MVRNEIDEIFKREGYRFCKVKPEEVGVYYRYYREGFHVVMAVNSEHGYFMTPEQHRVMEERIMGSFYHPQGILSDFPEGFPVYHVEALTLLVGDEGETLRRLCAECRNVWAYQPGSGRLLIYENQPGEFFGLRQAIEHSIEEKFDGFEKPDSKKRFWEKIKEIRFWRDMPYITMGLVIVNILVYLILEFMGDTTDGLFIAEHGGMYPTFLRDYHQWWRLLTAGFLHFGAAHLVNNMVLLYCMGSRMERAVGHFRLFIIYMLSLLGGSLLSYIVMLYTEDYAVSAGASGAIFGLIGGFLWVVILHKGRLEGITSRSIILMMMLSIYYGFSSGGIDNWGHIGGAVAGFAITALLFTPPSFQ